jgi:hypothetical protein
MVINAAAAACGRTANVSLSIPAGSFRRMNTSDPTDRPRALRRSRNRNSARANSPNDRFGSILLKKSFPADERNFSGPLTRFARHKTARNFLAGIHLPPRSFGSIEDRL